MNLYLKNFHDYKFVKNIFLDLIDNIFVIELKLILNSVNLSLNLIIITAQYLAVCLFTF